MYESCQIRGHSREELSPTLYERWGSALAVQAGEGAKFVVGGDVRSSTPRFLSALIEGLCTGGANLVDLGIVPAPMVYYARRRLRADGCAMVTASDRPADFNGLKWNIKGRPPCNEDVAILERAAETLPANPDGGKDGEYRTLDMSYDYVAWLQETWVRERPLELQIVVDPMHGTWSRKARRYLQAVFPRAFVSAIRDDPQADFDGGCSDGSCEAAFEPLSLSVEHQRADLGIALSGDGERVWFVDDLGTILTAEESTSILLDSYGKRLGGETFVCDLKFSDRVGQKAQYLGAEAAVERSGHTFLSRRMLDCGALFGAAVGGHYFFRDLEGADDGLFAACRMIDYLGRRGQSLSELRRACPATYITPELRVRVAPRHHAAVLNHVRANWLQYPHTLTDGVRVDFPDGWALVRESLSDDALTFRFEASDWSGLDKLVWQFSDGLPYVGDALWSRYEEAMGKHCHPG